MTESDERHDHDAIEYDEADWALDETVDEAEREKSTTTYLSIPTPVHDTVSTNSRVQNLPFPVILPQRRPGTKTRRFVRAYLQCLERCAFCKMPFYGF